jgi:hypothetical protein
MKSLATSWFVMQGVGFIVVAQTVADVDTGTAALIGNGVTVAVLAWYVVYDVRIRTPKMLDTFAHESNQMRATFTNTIDEVRRSFEKEQTDSRLLFLSEQNNIRNTFSQDKQAMREHHERELSDYKKLVLDGLEIHRRAVHDVKNTADVLMKKRDLEPT